MKTPENLKDFCFLAVEIARKMGAEYADARLITLRTESLDYKNGVLESCRSHFEKGIGVRVLYKGRWGFAANPDLKEDKVLLCTERAFHLSRASSIHKGENSKLLKSPPIHQGFYKTSLKRDPFQVSLKEKMELLKSWDEAMAGVEGVQIRKGTLDSWNEWKFFCNSEGADITQDITHVGAGIGALSIGEGLQFRSFPASFRGQHVQGGFEEISQLNILENAPLIAKEAVELHQARPCPIGKTNVVLGKLQLALQVHESCGHPVELDRALGMEANFAGTSFLTPDKLNKFQYGSPIVNIVCDSTSPGGLGTFGYDDDGCPAGKGDIIRNGLFVGYLTGRDTARQLSTDHNPSIRAEGWNNFPMIRMTNVNLLPGKTPFEEIISSIDEGILLEDNSSWSIDDRRLNFQFGCEMGWWIKNGKILDKVKNPSYSGITPQFWRNCQAISDEKTWKMWGTPNCGKGQPMQIARVGHGVSYAHFKEVQVGIES